MGFRFGQFLIVLGGLLFVLFALTVQAKETSLFLCAGAGICLIFGILVVIHYRSIPEASQRFRTYNKMRGVNGKEKRK